MISWKNILYEYSIQSLYFSVNYLWQTSFLNVSLISCSDILLFFHAGVLIPSSVQYFIKLPQGLRSSPLLVPLNDQAFSPLGGFVRWIFLWMTNYLSYRQLFSCIFSNHCGVDNFFKVMVIFQVSHDAYFTAKI